MPRTTEKPPPRKQGHNDVQPARLTYVEDLLASGMRSTAVVQAAMATLGVSKRTAERYVAKVYDKWEPETRAARRAAMRAQLQRMLAMAMGDEPQRRTVESSSGEDGKDPQRVDIDVVCTDLASAVRIADRLAKLDGLDAPSKVEHSGQVDTGPDLSGLSKDDRASLREILERARAKAE